MEAVRGRCTFEALEPKDLLDAVGSLRCEASPGFGTHGLHCPMPGDGSDYSAWALADIRASWAASSPEDKKPHATSAVLNARRALSRLVDWYMQRDGFAFCKDAPANSKAKSDILVRRKIIDSLSAKVLARAIDVRNVAEHEYVAPNEDAAEDAVELIRRTIESLMTAADPRSGPCFFGTLLHRRWWSAKRGEGAEFFGWQGEAAILATFGSTPWFGIILPQGPDFATVRRLRLADVPRGLLADALDTLEAKFGMMNGGSDVGFWKRISAEAGLDEADV